MTMTWAEIVKQGLPDDVKETSAVPSVAIVEEPLPVFDENAAIHVDAGINLTHRSFKDKVDQVLRDAAANGCRRAIVIGSSVRDSLRAVALVKEYNAKFPWLKLYCTVGVHPHEAERAQRDLYWVSRLDDLITANRDVVIAVGECGLDYNRMFSPKKTQVSVFGKQIKLAVKHGLPLYLHERDARDDFLLALDGTLQLRGVVHCFSGDADTAERYLAKGFYLGITGIICDVMRNADLLAALKTIVPVDRLLIETDAPYLVPKDLGNRPAINSSWYIPHITDHVATCMGMKTNDMAAQVWRNLQTLFGEMFV